MLKCSHAATLSDLLAKLRLLGDTNYKHIGAKIKKTTKKKKTFLLCQQ